MSQGQDFSEADYQSYWSLTPEERSQKLQDEQVPAAHKAILLFQQGLVCAEEKEYDRAIASYDKALEIQPDYYKALWYKGNALENLNRYEEAIASYDKSLEFNPNYYYSWNNRGNALRSLQRYEDAIASYDKALEIQPDNYE
jgi:tetratricopeptide (TPR) repeat protein